MSDDTETFLRLLGREKLGVEETKVWLSALKKSAKAVPIKMEADGECGS